MKQLHRADLFCWSRFNEEKNIDFNSFLWVRAEGNIAVDPLPLSDFDKSHLKALGGIDWIVLTNSDHIRASQEIANEWKARIAGPHGERDGFSIPCNRWLKEGDHLVPNLEILELHGSKTPGELALILDEDTLITGDLIRAHRAGSLMILPDPKLQDKSAALASLQRLTDYTGIEAVLVGDGWSVFRDGAARMKECFLLASQVKTP